MLSNNLRFLSSVFHVDYCLHRVNENIVFTKTKQVSLQDFEQEYFTIQSLDIDTYAWIKEYGALYAQELRYEGWYEAYYQVCIDYGF